MHFFVVKAIRNVKMFLLEFRDVTRTLIGGGGVYVHLFMFCSASFFPNLIQMDQFEKKLVEQNMNI